MNPLRYITVLVLTAIALAIHAYAYTGLVYNATYTSGYSTSDAILVLLPGLYNTTFVSKGVGCSNPLPSSVFNVNPYTLLVYMDTVGYPPNTTVTYTACSSPYYQARGGFPNATYVNLTVECVSSTESASGSQLQDLTGSDVYIELLSYSVPVHVDNVTVSVRVVFVYGATAGTHYNVYIVTDSGEELVGTGTSSQTFTVYNLYTGTLAVHVNLTGSAYYYYVYVTAIAYYEPPVYNETSVTVGSARVFYIVYGGGPGLASSGTINVTLDGSGWILFTPLISSVNGSRIQGIPGSNVTLAAWCYGSGIRTTLIATVYYGNATVPEVDPLYTITVNLPPSALTLNATLSLGSISVNLTQLSHAINASTRIHAAIAAYGIDGVTAALLLYSIVSMSPTFALLGFAAGFASVPIAYYSGDRAAVLASIGLTAASVITLLYLWFTREVRPV